MYDEHGHPLAYDHFPRHYLAGILHKGYRGESYAACRDLLFKGDWTSLLMQSPAGELPTGSGYVVKNRYPIQSRHGYESYSAHTCYNLLAGSMLAAAWQFADDTIDERPAPADVGGFVVPILRPFHKIFANAGGTYVQYDTAGDHVYNPTGLIRVHLRGGHPQLGPSDGCAPKFSGKGVNLCIGPAWKDAAGWHRLAEATSAAQKVEVLEETPARARFRVSFEIATAERSAASPVLVTETITVEARGVTVEDRLVGDGVRAMRVYYPMLVFDGLQRTKVKLQGSTVWLKLGGRGVRFTVVEPSGTSLTLAGTTLRHRNGLIEPAMAEIPGRRAVYRIAAE